MELAPQMFLQRTTHCMVTSIHYLQTWLLWVPNMVWGLLWSLNSSFETGNAYMYSVFSLKYKYLYSKHSLFTNIYCPYYRFWSPRFLYLCYVMWFARRFLQWLLFLLWLDVYWIQKWYTLITSGWKTKYENVYRPLVIATPTSCGVSASSSVHCHSRLDTWLRWRKNIAAIVSQNKLLKCVCAVRLK